jgi:hypothetical protein
MSHPPYVIEPGFEKQALPLTARQEAVVVAIHKELSLPTPFEVLPPVQGNPDLTASATDANGARVLIEVGSTGTVYRVAVWFEFAGFTGWATLGNSAAPLKLRVQEIARAVRRGAPALTDGTNAAE